MKFTASGLLEFLSILPVYDSLPSAARRELLGIQKPGQTVAVADFVDRLALIESGFLLKPNERGRSSLPADRLAFIRTLRTFNEPALWKPSLETFVHYVDAHLEAAERERLRDCAVNHSERNWILYRKVTSSDWIDAFLRARNENWERPYLLPDSPALLSDPEILRTTQVLIRWLLDRSGGRAPLREVAAMKDRERFSSALFAGLRYALLFVGLDQNLEPWVGIWPSVADLAQDSKLPAPASVVPSETYDSASMLMDDITTVLIACANEPFRLKANDSSLFAKTSRDLSLSLRPLPNWAEKVFKIMPEARVDVAITYCRTFGLVETRGHSQATVHVSGHGRQWLGLNASSRLRVLVDGVLNRPQTVPEFSDFEGAEIGAMAGHFHFTTKMKVPDTDAAFMRVFRALKGDGFFPLATIQKHNRTNGNPLLEVFQSDKNAVFWSSSAYLHRPDAEILQKVWTDAIFSCVQSRLFPLGAVRLGYGNGELSISMTPVGRYYLGQTNEWMWAESSAADILVQPNFEVIFLGESPVAEAEIGRFAERRGRQMGALFQITKKSVFAAAAAGMTADQMLATLTSLCSREIPGNVQHEMQGWFRQCRPVAFTTATLIRCPDRETALKIIAFAKGSAVALSDTVLEYNDPGKQRPALIKKLKEVGVIVSVEDKVAAPQHGGRTYSRGRGGWWR